MSSKGFGLLRKSFHFNRVSFSSMKPAATGQITHHSGGRIGWWVKGGTLTTWAPKNEGNKRTGSEMPCLHFPEKTAVCMSKWRTWKKLNVCVRSEHTPHHTDTAHNYTHVATKSAFVGECVRLRVEYTRSNGNGWVLVGLVSWYKWWCAVYMDMSMSWWCVRVHGLKVWCRWAWAELTTEKW